VNIDQYAYRVTWSAEDKEHVGVRAEFPLLSWLAANPEKALAGVRRFVKDVVADLKSAGEPIQQPLAELKLSSQFMVCVPPLVHRNPAYEAAKQGMCINRPTSPKLAV
jgi:predicted HicB family RNase H-like nuclease